VRSPYNNPGQIIPALLSFSEAVGYGTNIDLEEDNALARLQSLCLSDSLPLHRSIARSKAYFDKGGSPLFA